LSEHLLRVAVRAEEAAAAFGAGPWGRAAGLWHDLGKGSASFQRYLLAANTPGAEDEVRRGSVDHSTAGAQHAVETAQRLGHLLAYCIAGHHAGLQDGRGERKCLEARLEKQVEVWQGAVALLPAVGRLELPPFLSAKLSDRRRHPAECAFSFSFFVRMLFSCLVDADALDAGAFTDPGVAAARSPWPASILGRMEDALAAHLDGIDIPSGGNAVATARAEVRRACVRAAAFAPGLFSLTVPTGGGKTLSSLAFALRHALEHGMSRIVYVIPFTSIIEQNAAVFRHALRALTDAGIADPVLEHHSNVDVGAEGIEARLAAENWDAPLVVTTSVQFYESLFANRPSRCRKLHNLSRAVIILDEAQTLPVDYLRPCLLAIQELAQNYGSTVVLCTATQPAVHRRPGFEIGLEGIREIVPEPPRLYAALRRVEVADAGPLADADLVERLRDEQQILCVVNTRGHAAGLFRLLGDEEGHFHLSALMCAEHRSEVLARIRARLADRLPCRVVSTRLIEAGVDIDFPAVYRSLAGLDSIAQAAGRCNRNGSPVLGRVVLFRSEHERAEAFVRDTAAAAEQVLQLHADPLSLEAVEHYFRLYLWDQSSRWDAKGILDNFHLLSNDPSLPFLFGFATAAKDFRLIDDSGCPVIVPWGERGRDLCASLRAGPDRASRAILAGLQRYTVDVRPREFQRHVGRSIELVNERYAVLSAPQLQYSDRLGLVLDEPVPVLITA
jgi:CRISPR-associated endonuclease/helicase Cas3